MYYYIVLWLFRRLLGKSIGLAMFGALKFLVLLEFSSLYFSTHLLKVYSFTVKESPQWMTKFGNDKLKLKHT